MELENTNEKDDCNRGRRYRRGDRNSKKIIKVKKIYYNDHKRGCRRHNRNSKKIIKVIKIYYKDRKRGCRRHDRNSKKIIKVKKIYYNDRKRGCKRHRNRRGDKDYRFLQLENTNEN